MSSPHIVFCDSYEALNKLYDSGLPVNTKIITKSPTILNSQNSYVQNLEEHTNSIYRESFRKKSKKFTYEVFNSLKQNKNYSEYSILLAYKFLKFYNKVYFSSLFNDSFFDKEFWVVHPICKETYISDAISSEIYSILENHPKCKIKKIKVNITKERSPRGESDVGLFSRLRLVGYKGIFWYFVNFLSFFFRNKKYKIAVISSNELVRDISYYLLWKKNIKLFNFKSFFKDIKINRKKNDKNNKLALEMSEFINSIFMNALCDISSNKIRKLLISLWDKEVKEIIYSYENYKFYLEKFLIDNKVNMLFFGYVDMVRGLALHKVSQNKDIASVSCQHGITREIISDPDMRSIFFETSFSDHFFCYNSMSKKITENSSYIKNNNNIYSVGLPSDYKNLKSKKIRRKEICYISTLLLSGGIPNLIAPDSDITLINWELNLINNVLKKIGYNIDYKPYPAIRYPEDDIVIQVVKESENLKIVGTHLDFRYIISNYGLLITSGATSTLGWCAHSNIPLVFINRTGALSVKKTVMDDFKKAFFVFDDNNENWDKNLRIFLEKKYTDILELWDSKASFRLKVIKKYFGDINNNAGKNGADLINKFVINNYMVKS